MVQALNELDAEIFVVVEQDMYPCDFDTPEPIAARTAHYLRGQGIGSALATESQEAGS